MAEWISILRLPFSLQFVGPSFIIVEPASCTPTPWMSQIQPAEMPNTSSIFLRVVAFAVVCVLTLAEGRQVYADDKSQSEFFSSEVLPILQGKCFKCHGGEETEGSLRLTSRENLLEGGDNGAAVNLDSPEDSLLISAINYEDLEMPPTGKLPEAQIEVLTRWIKMGRE